MTHDPIRIPVNVSDGNYCWHCFSDITPDLARQIVALGQAEDTQRMCADIDMAKMGQRIARLEEYSKAHGDYHEVRDGGFIDRLRKLEEPTPVNDLLTEAANPGTAPEPFLGAAHQSELERAHDEAQALIESLHRKGNQEAARLANIIAKLRAELDAVTERAERADAVLNNACTPGYKVALDAARAEADTLAGLLLECRNNVMRYGKPGLTERVDAMLKERKP
jgi:hypothetical protein